MRPNDAESTLSLPFVAALLLQAALPSAAAPASPGVLPVPRPFSPPPPAAAAPRRIDDLERPLTGAVPQGSYEAGVRGSIARAQSLQGPLDGGWIVSDAAGARLFRFQLVDAGYAGGQLDGAWSDLRAGGPASGGFFSGVERSGVTVTFRFARAGAGLMTAVVEPRLDGTWAGELVVSQVGQPDVRTAVVMRRP